MKRLIFFLLFGFLLLAGVYTFYFPDVSVLKKKNPRTTSFMKYRETGWRASGQQRKINQTWVPFARISPYLVKAIIIAEDAKFWSHEGFDYEAIQAAIESDLKLKKYKRGGSTITQQLAKNLYLKPEKSLLRKIREAVITWKLERTLSKRRILELYLNVVEWGDGLYGVEAASRYYFAKPASEVTAMEAARLVSVLPNPRKYRPDGNQKYVEKRSTVIYQIMVERGIVVPEFEEMLHVKEPLVEISTPPATGAPPLESFPSTAPVPVPPVTAGGSQ
ncbi:MAG: monofunctional biosynthetic peptidoglycan transglycosylase [Nitrospirae bacterium]|nr:monofunctional biosynthetic peptidoglycan transglycosylase [Nitrospirota bacterium]MBI3351401.1 monofunctional biosynthetic peptidoglycan transglycosylase [Nitrospirota bacterium]